MNKQKIGQEDTNIKKVTWAGTISLIVLLLLFLIVTLFSTNSLATKIKLLTEHPFTVNRDISDVKTNLALMRIRTERLQSYRGPGDIEAVREALNSLYTDMEALLDEIGALYLGADEDIQALRNTYEQIQEAHRLFLEFAGKSNSGNDVIAGYEEEHLYPLYDAFEEDAAQILSFVHGTQQNIFTSAERMSKSVVIWSCIIIVATILGLFSSSWSSDG